MSIVQNRKRESAGVLEELVEEKIYLAIKIITGITGILCAKKGWEEENCAILSIFEQFDNQKQLSIATNFRFDK